MTSPCIFGVAAASEIKSASQDQIDWVHHQCGEETPESSMVELFMRKGLCHELSPKMTTLQKPFWRLKTQHYNTAASTAFNWPKTSGSPPSFGRRLLGSRFDRILPERSTWQGFRQSWRGRRPFGSRLLLAGVARRFFCVPYPWLSWLCWASPRHRSRGYI